MVYISRSRAGFFLGLFIVAIGIVLLLDQQGIVSAHYFYRFFWPAIFIFFGVEFLISCGGRGSRAVAGFLMLAFGGLLLAGAVGYLHVGFQTVWPLALIIWGIWVIARTLSSDRGLGERIRDRIHDSIHDKVSDAVANDPNADWRARRDWRRTHPREWAETVKNAIQETVTDWTGRESADPEFDYMAVFGGIKQRVTVKNFRGGRLTALFGGFEIDLTRADIEGQTAVIDASALMGGGEIRVPYTWVVEIQGMAILGGYTDETHQDIPEGATPKRLIVKGVAALGGVVIKN